tara:strand:+ start:8454 stop:8771 length:318 start_codon:yes stop_codon:yes gene_type:complete
MCDVSAKLGTIKKFNKASDVDGFIKTLCTSMSSLAHRQFRVFVANDEVEQHEVDHHALMGDNYGLDFRSNSIKEVDTLEIAADCNEKMSKLLDRRNRSTKLERAT